VRGAALGDVAEALGFEAFFQAEYPGLVRALYLLTGDQDEAEDLAQATMARVYERWDRVRVMDSPAGYVYRAAVNLHRQRLRHLAVRARRLLAMAAQAASTQPAGPGVGWSWPTRSPRCLSGSGRRSCWWSGWG
jgi:DNA-directed RNA polymerase specialized sigma24 family protein